MFKKVGAYYNIKSFFLEEINCIPWKEKKNGDGGKPKKDRSQIQYVHAYWS